jgi:ABC-2 type transport system permease protein
MAEVLEWASAVLPLTYAYDALERATQIGDLDAELWLDVAVLSGSIALALALGALTLSRRTP